MGKISNAIQMLNYLNTGNKYSVKELSKKLGITERMVRYYLEGDRYLIDISLLVNHAFQDGYHMGLFFNNLQQNIYNLKVNKNLVKVR